MNWEVAAEPLPLPKISAPPDSSPCALPSLNKQISFRTSKKKKKNPKASFHPPPPQPSRYKRQQEFFQLASKGERGKEGRQIP